MPNVPKNKLNPTESILEQLTNYQRHSSVILDPLESDEPIFPNAHRVMDNLSVTQQDRLRMNEIEEEEWNELTKTVSQRGIYKRKHKKWSYRFLFLDWRDIVKRPDRYLAEIVFLPLRFCVLLPIELIRAPFFLTRKCLNELFTLSSKIGILGLGYTTRYLRKINKNFQTTIDIKLTKSSFNRNSDYEDELYELDAPYLLPKTTRKIAKSINLLDD